MRTASAILLALIVATPPSAEARPRARPHGVSDMDRILARRAAHDRRGWADWEERRPIASILPPATRERVAAPPFTGWGYGGTVPGAWPGF